MRTPAPRQWLWPRQGSQWLQERWISLQSLSNALINWLQINQLIKNESMNSDTQNTAFNIHNKCSPTFNNNVFNDDRLTIDADNAYMRHAEWCTSRRIITLRCICQIWARVLKKKILMPMSIIVCKTYIRTRLLSSKSSCLMGFLMRTTIQTVNPWKVMGKYTWRCRRC